jgi:hypothetical protein
MYPETTPTTVDYIWKNHIYHKELNDTYSFLVHCGRTKQQSYPACITMWDSSDKDYIWKTYLELCDTYFNEVEKYLVEHYPEIAMEAFMLQNE